MYQAPISAYPTAKLMICTNHRPKWRDTSEAVWRRMIEVQFNNVVPKNKIDLNLAEKIKKTELSGVLAWAVDGLRMLQHFGKFIEPESIKNAIEEYKRELFPELNFFEDHLEETVNEECFASCKEVRDAYERYCKSGNYGVKNDTNFGKAIKKKFPKTERVRVSKSGQRHWIYQGIRIKIDSEYLNQSGKNE
jgi:putative DNA primase/helicase